LSTPNRICSRPATTTTVKAMAGWWANSMMMVAMTTVMGPVGPDTWEGVPPNTAAVKPP